MADLHECILQENFLFSTLILGSLFSDMSSVRDVYLADGVSQALHMFELLEPAD